MEFIYNITERQFQKLGDIDIENTKADSIVYFIYKELMNFKLAENLTKIGYKVKKYYTIEGFPEVFYYEREDFYKITIYDIVKRRKIVVCDSCFIKALNKLLKEINTH